MIEQTRQMIEFGWQEPIRPWFMLHAEPHGSVRKITRASTLTINRYHAKPILTVV